MALKRAGFLFLTFVIVLVSAVGLVAQSETNNDVGLVIGGTTTPALSLTTGGGLNFNSSLALGAEYDRRLTSKRTAVFAGIDFLASPLDVKLSNPPADVIPQYAYVFLTPHVRLKFDAGGAFEPWLSFGGGYARFSETRPVTTPSFRGGTNTGTLEFGGGIDTGPIVHVLRIPIGFRVEVRDFYSGTPTYNQKINNSLQNNVVYTGGLLLRF